LTPEKPNNGSRPLHERVFYAGVSILVAGLTGAALIYLFSADAKTAAIEFANPRAYEFQIERIGGMAAVYAVRFNEWFISLWQGRQLAFTMAVLAIAISLVCFWLANRMAATMHDDDDQGGVK
jgi:hypothetical protein